MADDRVSPAEAAKLLGICRREVNRLDAAGKLGVPEILTSGHRKYLRADVLALAEARAIAKHGKRAAATQTSAEAPRGPTAEQCKRAFEMFAQKCTLAEIVVACLLTPQQVRELYAEYTTSLDAPAPVAAASASVESRRQAREREVHDEREYQANMRAWEREQAEIARRQAEEDAERRRRREDANRELERLDAQLAESVRNLSERRARGSMKR